MSRKSGKAKKETIEAANEDSHEEFCLYKMMGLEDGPQSTPEQIKQQYKKMVIRFHPDKNQGDPTAREKFQKLREAYDILSDPERRKLYDNTGSMGDLLSQQAFQSAYQYYRTLYKKIEKQDIDAFEKEYREGQMEQQDLLAFYQQHKGNMTSLMEAIPLSHNADIPRFIQFFQRKIGQGQIKKYKIFETTKEKVKLLKDQSKEFAKQKEEQQSFEKLSLAIKGKPTMSFLDALEAKYAEPVKKTKTERPQQAVKRGKKQVR